MHSDWSRKLLLASLVGLIIAAPWWLLGNSDSLAIGWAIFAGALVPALLMRAVIRQSRNWSGITALCMIPFACIGIMDIVASSGAFDAGMAVAIISITIFFAALDAGRRA